MTVFGTIWGAWKASRAIRSLSLLTAILTAIWAYGAIKEAKGRNGVVTEITQAAEKQVVQAKKARARGDAEPDPVEWMRRHRCTGC